MSIKVYAITAVGTRGKVKGNTFSAMPRSGFYILHSEVLAAKSGKPTRFAVNKVRVATLDEAATLLASGGYHIRLFNTENNQWNLRSAASVVISRL